MTSRTTGDDDPNDGPQLAALAIGHDGERADRDHHRVARADLHERLRLAARLDEHRDDQLVRLEGVPLHADEELLESDAAHAAHARELDLGVLDEERRERVAGGRGRPEVPADRPAVANLRRADRPRRLGQRRERLGELAAHRLRVGEAGAEPERPVLARPAAQLGDLVQVEDRRRVARDRS